MIDKLMTDRSSRITLIDNITEVVMKPREMANYMQESQVLR